jgi:hypothetical protein
VDNYQRRVLKAIRELDASDSEPHPALHLEQVAAAMEPPETDADRLDRTIAALVEFGFLEAAIPAIQQTQGPVSFRLTW